MRLQIDAERPTRIPAASTVVRGTLGRLGPVECRLRGRGRDAAGSLDLGRLPRGRYSISDTTLTLGDHLGLQSVKLPVRATGEAIVVYPRLVELDALFCDSGRLGSDGRRLLLRRPAGFDFHSVREYTQGESLRRVHWPTTARRGQLMVKELEDTPHDAVAVVLDCDPAAVAGSLPTPASTLPSAPPAPCFGRTSPAAGGRSGAQNGVGRGGSAVRSLEGDFTAALGALAEPRLMRRTGSAAGSEARRRLRRARVSSWSSPGTSTRPHRRRRPGARGTAARLRGLGGRAELCGTTDACRDGAAEALRRRDSGDSRSLRGGSRGCARHLQSGGGGHICEGGPSPRAFCRPSRSPSPGSASRSLRGSGRRS